MTQALDDLRRWAPSLALGIVLLVLAFAAARIARSRIARSTKMRRLDPSLAALLTNLAYVAILAIGVIAALDTVNVRVNSIITALGVSGLALSLALQDVLRNFVAGVYILLEKPFNLGDRIALRDVAGDVMDIQLRTTLLRTPTGANVIVPNSIVMTEVVTNRSLTLLQPYLVTISGDRSILADGLSGFSEIAAATGEPGAHSTPEVVIESIEAETAVVRVRLWTDKDSSTVSQVVSELRDLHPEATVVAKVDE
ncbi:MAG: mechanosensitive ion channel domain-containing protein [Chloroflexia bacterium]